jgi:hypothetical protein
MKSVLLSILTMTTLHGAAQDTLQVAAPDTLSTAQPEKKMSWLRRTIRGFSYIDERYVEPQHYNWSVMLQATYNYDYYRLSTIGRGRQSISFAPTPTIKLGPYFGWRWVFLGYTFDLRQVDLSSNSTTFDFSFYSAQIGADIYYRRTGSNYKVRNVDLGHGIDTHALEEVPFDGINVGITGVTAYYIFNHQRFSYPAAFNQSTCQKISCGSWMVGAGYLRNSIDFDHERLQSLVDERMPGQQVKLDSGLMFNSVKYYDVNVSVGYGYNWVFARNWLLGASLSVALAYKNSYSESEDNESHGFNIQNFNIANVYVDGIGRFGIVWNNTRWYAGASAIVRAYNYHNERFAANNIFGKLNVYVGYNFGARSRYKKKR